MNPNANNPNGTKLPPDRSVLKMVVPRVSKSRWVIAAKPDKLNAWVIRTLDREAREQGVTF